MRKNILGIFLVLTPSVALADGIPMTFFQVIQQRNSLITFTIIYFILVILLGAFNILAISNLLFGEDPRKPFFNPLAILRAYFQRGGNVKCYLHDQNNIPISFNEIVIFNDKGKRILQRYSGSDGSAEFSAQAGVYSLVVNRFGYKKIDNSSFKVENTENVTELVITLAPTNEVLLNPKSSAFIEACRISWVGLMLAGITFLSAWLNLFKSDLGIITCFFCSLLIILIIFASTYQPSLRLLQTDKRPIRNKGFKLLSFNGEILHSKQLRGFTKIRALAGKGFYKITVDGFETRNIRVNQRTLLGLKLRLKKL